MTLLQDKVSTSKKFTPDRRGMIVVLSLYTALLLALGIALTFVMVSINGYHDLMASAKRFDAQWNAGNLAVESTTIPVGQSDPVVVPLISTDDVTLQVPVLRDPTSRHDVYADPDISKVTNLQSAPRIIFVDPSRCRTLALSADATQVHVATTTPNMRFIAQLVGAGGRTLQICSDKQSSAAPPQPQVTVVAWDTSQAG